MATIMPFKGIRYNPKKIDHLNLVVTQPYDKITDQMQEEYYQKHPLSIVRLIRGKTLPEDTPTNNVYSRARDYFREWQKEGILVQDREPSLYAYDQEYTSQKGEKRVRKGFITALKLEEFSSGIVLPHERTHSKPKEDRLNLLKAAGANFGQIFMLYPDPENRVNQLLADAKQGKPDMEALAEYGVTHRVWRISDVETIDKVKKEMGDKSLVIADGHHRYETALNYRNWMREQNPNCTGEELWNYRMVTLVSMEDKGLTILPTHRLLHGLEGFDFQGFLKDCAKFFKVERTDGRDKLLGEMESRALNHMVQGRGAREHIFGLYAGRGEYHLLTLKDEGLVEDFVERGRAPEWKTLDVTICHSLIIENLLGVSQERVTAQENIGYIREPDEGIRGVDEGKYQLIIFLNPTRMTQVKAIAEKGEAMPQKSTDFFPKLLSGLVIFKLTE